MYGNQCYLKEKNVKSSDNNEQGQEPDNQAAQNCGPGRKFAKKNFEDVFSIFFSFAPSLKFIFAAEIESGRKNQGLVL